MTVYKFYRSSSSSYKSACFAKVEASSDRVAKAKFTKLANGPLWGFITKEDGEMVARRHSYCGRMVWDDEWGYYRD